MSVTIKDDRLRTIATFDGKPLKDDRLRTIANVNGSVGVLSWLLLLVYSEVYT